MDVLSTDVSMLRCSAPRNVLPLHMVKIIIAEVVEALAQLHSLRIIHTGLPELCDIFCRSQTR